LRLTVIAASAVTLLFALSTIFSFGAATHKEASMRWYASSSDADEVQIIAFHGQFHLAINFLVSPGRAPPAQPRGWYAGARYRPGCDLDVLVSEHVTSHWGADLYWDSVGPRLYVGVFGLYPVLLLWGLAWLIARRKGHDPGHCPTCGYDLRATPQEGGALLDRCPECGMEAKRQPVEGATA
jgi:hypothetical protein